MNLTVNYDFIDQSCSLFSFDCWRANDPALVIVQMNSGQVLESLRPHFVPTIKI